MNAPLPSRSRSFDKREPPERVTIYRLEPSTIERLSREFGGLAALSEETTVAPEKAAGLFRSVAVPTTLGAAGLLYVSWRLFAAKAIVIPLVLHVADHVPTHRNADMSAAKHEVLLSKTSRLPVHGGRVIVVSASASASVSDMAVLPHVVMPARSLVDERLRLALLSSDAVEGEHAIQTASLEAGEIPEAAAAETEWQSADSQSAIDPSLEAALQDIDPPVPVSRPDQIDIIQAVIPIARPRVDDDQNVDTELSRLPVTPVPTNRPDGGTAGATSTSEAEPRKKRTLFGLLGFAKADDEDAKSPFGSTVRRRDGVAIYDISAGTVYLPNGEKLEAHSGIGPMRDKPDFVDQPNKGPTPPHTYYLSLRENPFHGVEAIRLTPVEGEDAIFGRNGLLAHTYMLGKEGDSNGCVVFKDYDRFLTAFKTGAIKQMVVVPRLREAPSSVFASLLSSKN